MDATEAGAAMTFALENPSPRYDHTSERTGTGSDIWCTPIELVEMLERKLRVLFTLDAAANGETTICSGFDGHWLGPGSEIATDALSLTGQQWARLTNPELHPDGAVWCNPPYSRLTPDPWADRLVECGRYTTTVALVPVRPDTAWCQKLVRASELAYVPSGRIQFGRADGEDPGNGSPGAVWAIVLRPGARGPMRLEYVPHKPEMMAQTAMPLGRVQHIDEGTTDAWASRGGG